MHEKDALISSLKKSRKEKQIDLWCWLTHDDQTGAYFFHSFPSLFLQNSFFRCEENKIGFFWCKRKRERRITITFFVDFGSLAFDDILFLDRKRFLQETHQRKRYTVIAFLLFKGKESDTLCATGKCCYTGGGCIISLHSSLSTSSSAGARREQEEDLNDLERPKERLSRGMIFCEDSVRFLSFSCSQRRSLLKADPGQSSRCLRRWTLWCLMTQETCLSSSLLVSPSSKHARRKSQNLRCINCVPDSSLIALLFYSHKLSFTLCTPVLNLLLCEYCFCNCSFCVFTGCGWEEGRTQTALLLFHGFLSWDCIKNRVSCLRQWLLEKEWERKNNAPAFRETPVASFSTIFFFMLFFVLLFGRKFLTARQKERERERNRQRANDAVTLNEVMQKRSRWERHKTCNKTCNEWGKQGKNRSQLLCYNRRKSQMKSLSLLVSFDCLSRLFLLVIHHVMFFFPQNNWLHLFHLQSFTRIEKRSNDTIACKDWKLSFWCLWPIIASFLLIPFVACHLHIRLLGVEHLSWYG